MPETDEPPEVTQLPPVGPCPTQLVAVPKALASGGPDTSSLPKGIDSKGPLYAKLSQAKFEDVAYWVGYSEAAQDFALHEPSEPRAPADSDRAQAGLCTALTEPPVECAQPLLGFAKEHPGLLSKRNRFTGRTAEPTKTTTAKDTSSPCKTSAASGCPSRSCFSFTAASRSRPPSMRRRAAITSGEVMTKAYGKQKSGTPKRPAKFWVVRKISRPRCSGRRS